MGLRVLRAESSHDHSQHPQPRAGEVSTFRGVLCPGGRLDWERSVSAGWMPSRRVLVVLAAGLVILVVAIVGLRRGLPVLREVPFSDLVTLADAGALRAVVVDGDRLTIEWRDGTHGMTVAPPGYVAGNPLFVAELARRRVEVRVARGRRDDGHPRAGGRPADARGGRLRPGTG